ncbi:MAG TPA: hypothetical protein VIV11_00145 [Kofleriaceae bacterium]
MKLAIAVPLYVMLGCAEETVDDPIVEPELTQEEVALLPDGSDHDHDDSELLAGAPDDDVTVFDDDDAELRFDREVSDGDAPSTETIAYQPLLKWGLHPRASDALRAAGVSASRITQTIGNAPASAGVHLQDGTVNGQPYTAAIDLSTSGLTSTQIHNLLERLAKVGYAGWYRKTGSDGWNGSNHIHAVYANCKMKLALRSQIRSWLVGRNGLASNTLYKWHLFSAEAKQVVKAKFAQSESGTTNGGAGFSARVNTSGAALTIRAAATRSSTAIGSVSDGSYVTIKCQKYGESVTGTYGTTKLWDKIGTGYISDAYVATGSDGRVAPLCP